MTLFDSETLVYFQGNFIHMFLIHLLITHQNVIWQELFEVQEACNSLFNEPKEVFFFFTLLVFRKGMEFFFSSLLSRKASGQKVVISCVEIQANETQIIGI